MIPSKQLLVLLLFVTWTWTANSAPAHSCEYKCGDGSCIPTSWICDNVKDCTDGGDESNCNYLHKCNANEFMCRSGECIPASEKCNNVADCSDSSDEKDCQQAAQAQVGNLPSAEDFEDGLKHVAISATPVAVKPILRKQAQCPQRNATLYFTNSDASVLRLRITDAPQSPQILLDGNLAENDAIISLSFNHDLRELLFVSKRVPNRVRAIDDEANVRLFASHDAERFGQVAVDPVTKNIYFAENGVGIGVCDEAMKSCVMLTEAESFEVRYRDLILNPKLGQMFWIQEDLSAVLKVAGMDGKKMRILSSFEHVHAISLDAANDELYIAEEEAVVVLNLQTLVRHSYVSVRTSSMVYYNCDLYYVQRGHEILRMYTSRGEDKEILVLAGASFRFVVVPDDFESTQVNPCDNLSCPEVCVLTDGAAVAQCVCRICEAVGVDEASSSIVGWVISILLILLLLTSVAMFIVAYFRLWPALCDRLDALLGLNAHDTSNISVGFNRSDHV